MGVGAPIMHRWSRMKVTGMECLPATGPVIIVADHDSYWDPIAIGVAARRVRPIRALAKSTLWKTKIVAAFMDRMGHIPVIRGTSNTDAMAVAVEELAKGACIGMFPEGTRSLGRELRARSGVGWLAKAVPDATVVCVRTNGTTDVVRVPKRPSVTLEFYLPRGGQLQPDESPLAFSRRLLAELREEAPPEIAGRAKKAAKYRSEIDAEQKSTT
jgi:1-acyl-sn-glycerol-3-phosphate acyltransferase